MLRLGTSDELKQWWLLADEERRRVNLSPGEAMYAVYTGLGWSPADAYKEAARDFALPGPTSDAGEWRYAELGVLAEALEQRARVVAYRAWVVEHQALSASAVEQSWSMQKSERVLTTIVGRCMASLEDTSISRSRTVADTLLGAVKELNRMHRIGEKDAEDDAAKTLRVIFSGEERLE